MKIIYATGQTCNKFWAWSRYIAEAIAHNRKIIILDPDITFKDYPELQNNAFIKFPTYSSQIGKILGYKRYIELLSFLFANKISVNLLYLFFKIIPQIEYVKTGTRDVRISNMIKYFGKIKPLFTPSDTVIDYCESEFTRVRADVDIILGVHVRYGDYRTFRNGKYFYSLKEYEAKVNEFEKIFRGKKVAIFIASNEKLDLSAWDKHYVFSFKQGSSTKDLYGLMLCDYIIGPPSTFSGWASYLGEKPLFFLENITGKIEVEKFTNVLNIWGDAVENQEGGCYW